MFADWRAWVGQQTRATQSIKLIFNAKQEKWHFSAALYK